MENKSQFQYYGQLIIILLPSIISIVGLLFANYVERKRRFLYDVFIYLLSPIYDILSPYIEDNATEPSKSKVKELKSSILKTVYSGKAPCPTKLYKLSKALTNDTFRDYCAFILRNYHSCAYKLDIYMPYEYHGKEIKRARTVSISSGVVWLISLILLLVFKTNLSPTIFAILVIIFITSSVVLFISRSVW